jgi:hypothetical protein
MTICQNTQKDGSSGRPKINEQYGNVIENTGSFFHSSRRSGNVIENKDSYARNVGISLKTNRVI